MKYLYTTIKLLLFFCVLFSLNDVFAQQIIPYHCRDISTVKTGMKEPTSIFFENKYKAKIFINILNSNGKYIKRGSLNPDDTITIQGFISDKWVVSNEQNDCIMFFVSETKSQKKAIIKDHIDIWNRDLKPIDCKKESTLRSVEGTPKTNIFIINRAGVKLKVYWLDYEGKRIYFNSIGTGQAYLQETQMNHYWILTDEFENCFGIFSSNTSEISNVFVGSIPKIKSTLPFLSGTITDRLSDKGLITTIFIVPKNSKDTIKTTSNSYGEFSVPLAEGKYQFLIRKNGYLNYSEQIIITPESNEFTFSMTPMLFSTSFIIHKVFFFQSTSNLLPQSDTSLNRLYQLMEDNKSITIRLEGHTDNQDTKSLNQGLSEDRAFTIKRYLVEKGIDEKRITTIGYAGTKPIASNLKEETRKLNRRVEFRLIK